MKFRKGIEMNVDDVLRIIRAMKTFNISHVKCDTLELTRGVEVSMSNDIQSAELPKEVIDYQEKAIGALQQELDEIEDENLLISDPEEYEKRMNHV